jgi:hypothetical protein
VISTSIVHAETREMAHLQRDQHTRTLPSALDRHTVVVVLVVAEVAETLLAEGGPFILMSATDTMIHVIAHGDHEVARRLLYVARETLGRSAEMIETSIGVTVTIVDSFHASTTRTLGLLVLQNLAYVHWTRIAGQGHLTRAISLAHPLGPCPMAPIMFHRRIGQGHKWTRIPDALPLPSSLQRRRTLGVILERTMLCWPAARRRPEKGMLHAPPRRPLLSRPSDLMSGGLRRLMSNQVQLPYPHRNRQR